MWLRLSTSIALLAVVVSCNGDDSNGDDAGAGGGAGVAGNAGTGVDAGRGGAGGSAGASSGSGGMGAGGHAGAAGVAGMAGSSGSAGRGGSGGGSGDGGGGAGGDPDPCEAAMLAEDKCPVCDDDASCDAATYTDNGDQTVSSSCCDLVWQQVVDAAQFDHEDAAAYCTGLGMAGGGWRLPTKDELLSLIAEGNMPPIDPVAFPNTEQGVFWSSTLVRNSPNNAWSVGFLDAGGYAQPSTRATTSKVRCVR